MYKSCQLTLSNRLSFVTERGHVHTVTHSSLIPHIRRVQHSSALVSLKTVMQVGPLVYAGLHTSGRVSSGGGACKFQGRLPLHHCQCYPRPRSPPTPNHPSLYPPRNHQANGFDLHNMSNRALCNNALPTVSPIAAYS